jgi:hypothetical protein
MGTSYIRVTSCLRPLQHKVGDEGQFQCLCYVWNWHLYNFGMPVIAYITHTDARALTKCRRKRHKQQKLNFLGIFGLHIKGSNQKHGDQERKWKQYIQVNLCIASRLALRPTQPPIQWVPGALSLGVKRPRREANHSPLSSTEVKNGGAIPPPQRLHGVVLN